MEIALVLFFHVEWPMWLVRTGNDCSSGRVALTSINAVESHLLWSCVDRHESAATASCGEGFSSGEGFGGTRVSDAYVAAIRMPAKPPDLRSACEKMDNMTGPQTDEVPHWIANYVRTTRPRRSRVVWESLFEMA